MSVERETLREAALATVGVAVFIAFLVAGGSASGNGVGENGAFLMVGGIVAFIVVMAVIGIVFMDED